jgi:hypothetical protein
MINKAVREEIKSFGFSSPGDIDTMRKFLNSARPASRITEDIGRFRRLQQLLRIK